MRLARFIFLLACISLAPFAVNAAGTHVYFYITLGPKQIVIAAAEGVSHNALADKLDDDWDQLDPAAAQIIAELEAEMAIRSSQYTLDPFMLYTESTDGFRPYRFHVMTQRDYLGLEFPWLLIPAGLFTLGAWRFRRCRRCRADAASQGD